MGIGEGGEGALVLIGAVDARGRGLGSAAS